MLHAARVVLVVCLACVVEAAREPAFLGVTMSAWANELRVGEQSFPFGVRIDSVTPQTAAAKAGLRAGDIIVEVDGRRFDCKPGEAVARLGEAIRAHQVGDTMKLTVLRDSLIQSVAGEAIPGPSAWEAVEKRIAGLAPGEHVDFRAEKQRELLTVTAALGPRPVALGCRTRVIPPNDQILPAPAPADPTQRLVEALVTEVGAADDYHAQRAMLAQLVARRDALCPLRTACVMREPFTLPALSRDLAKSPGTIDAMLRHAAAWLDQPAAENSTEPLRVGLSPEQHARQIEGVLREAHEAWQRALAKLSAEERALVAETIPLLSDEFRDDVMIQRDPDRQRFAKVLRLVGLAARVDRGELIRAARSLARLLDAKYLAGLRADLAGHGAGVFLTQDTGFGKIVFAGTGDTWHRQAAAVIVDLGGDDFYTGATQQPLSLIIDLAGDDEYAATFAQAQAAGRLGVAILYDEAGDDRYRARRWGQGAAAVGVGILWDHAGNDSYRAGDYAQAAALCGVGLLIDDEGDDRYDAERCGQGFALPGGFAALIDRAGEDHYYCKGRDLGSYGTPGIFAGWGQGCAAGLRGVASGGVALLLDEAGDDVYEAGNFSQGGGYYFGWGTLVDRSGNDRYLGSRYAQAFAAHQAIGYLEDDAGNDIYRTTRDVGQSCSWDQTVTFLIDRAGDDSYSAGGFALGAAAHNGIAVFLDGGGLDRYLKNGGRARASGNDYHGGTSLSLILDLGGDEDLYSGSPAANNRIRHTQEHGFFADVPTTLPEALTRFQDWLER